MLKRVFTLALLCCIALQVAAQQPGRIVSLNGTFSEILAGLGLENNIVGTDITSNYPASMKAKPKVGHNRNISAEGVLSLQPNIVVAAEGDTPPALAEQLKGAGIKLLQFRQQYTPQGTIALITSLGNAFGRKAQAAAMIKTLNSQLASANAWVSKSRHPKVLFIYARGAGTLMVAGTGTSADAAIRAAGARNAVTAFSNFKPLTAEALVTANPDYLLLFDSGLQSLGGISGLQKIPGIMQTNAGRQGKVITMDGELLTGFGPRLGQAITQLAQKLSH